MEIGVAAAGETVGATALRAGASGERNATVTSMEAAELLRVEAEDYDELLRARDRDDDVERRAKALRASPALSKLRPADHEELARRCFFQTYRRPSGALVRRFCYALQEDGTRNPMLRKISQHGPRLF